MLCWSCLKIFSQPQHPAYLTLSLLFPPPLVVFATEGLDIPRFEFGNQVNDHMYILNNDDTLTLLKVYIIYLFNFKPSIIIHLCIYIRRTAHMIIVIVSTLSFYSDVLNYAIMSNSWFFFTSLFCTRNI